MAAMGWPIAGSGRWPYGKYGYQNEDVYRINGKSGFFHAMVFFASEN